MKLYITQMLRWGDTESHHYIVGVFSDKEKAVYAGEVEAAWRGGKYSYRIEEADLDVNVLIDDEKELWYKECKGGRMKPSAMRRKQAVYSSQEPF